MMTIALPPRLRGVFFDRHWDTQKLWQLPTAVSLVATAELEWHLDLTVWSTVKGEPRFDLSPRLVMQRPQAFRRHWMKIVTADLAYPIELFPNHRRWVIVDGYHRLARHVLERRLAIDVRLHPEHLWSQVR
jgi:hypothetical protein